MRFKGEGKRTFADARGPYLEIRFVNGEYETTDETEIRLLKGAGVPFVGKGYHRGDAARELLLKQEETEGGRH